MRNFKRNDHIHAWNTHDVCPEVINPRRTCARVAVLGLCVCVTTSPATTHNWASNWRYLRLRRKLGSILNMVFSLKMLRSKVMASFTYLAVSDHFTASHLDGGAYSCLKAYCRASTTQNTLECNVASLSSPALLFRISFAIFRILSHGM